MKIALIGHGAMGQLVAAEARKAGDRAGECTARRRNNGLERSPFRSKNDY